MSSVDHMIYDDVNGGGYGGYDVSTMADCIMVISNYTNPCCMYTQQMVSKWKKTTTLAFGVTVLLLFSAKTLARNWEWGNTQTLAESGLRVNWDNAKVHMTMGNVLAQQVCVCVCVC